MNLNRERRNDLILSSTRRAQPNIIYGEVSREAVRLTSSQKETVNGLQVTVVCSTVVPTFPAESVDNVGLEKKRGEKTVKLPDKLVQYTESRKLAETLSSQQPRIG